MKTSRLTVLAIAVLGVSAGAGLGAAASGSVDLGFAYGLRFDAAGQSTLVIESVQPGGLAAFEGVQPGSTVTNVDGVLTTLPGELFAQETAEMTRPNIALWVTPPGQPLPSSEDGLAGHRTPQVRGTSRTPVERGDMLGGLIHEYRWAA